MSGFTPTKIESLLPEDIESLINKINSEVAILERKKFDLTNEVEAKKNEVTNITNSLKLVKDNYNKIVSDSEVISAGLRDREAKVAQKEADLDLYSNALQEKERSVNKYLAAFEGIRNALKK